MILIIGIHNFLRCKSVLKPGEKRPRAQVGPSISLNDNEAEPDTQEALTQQSSSLVVRTATSTTEEAFRVFSSSNRHLYLDPPPLWNLLLPPHNTFTTFLHFNVKTRPDRGYSLLASDLLAQGFFFTSPESPPSPSHFTPASARAVSGTTKDQPAHRRPPRPLTNRAQDTTPPSLTPGFYFSKRTAPRLHLPSRISSFLSTNLGSHAPEKGQVRHAAAASSSARPWAVVFQAWLQIRITWGPSMTTPSTPPDLIVWGWALLKKKKNTAPGKQYDSLPGTSCRPTMKGIIAPRGEGGERRVLSSSHLWWFPQWR